ncbi:MAG: histidine--tRNA ligase [Treponema sp.]|jgi:histidyl-tRNA synthetase|nr:histidine--tRNA ligase [Treponema sp.]
MISYIEPKILKGFRDFLPPAEIARRDLIEKIEAVFRSYGFVPIDTPALEYARILLGKGGGETEKQIYRFNDNGDRDVALRFDLTVPFARFVALHLAEITLPFKRYHIAKVWRGENTQRGRYREFTQCDVDTVGSDSPASDFEILLMIRNVFTALGVDVSIRVNHRGLFNRFLVVIGTEEKSVEILRTVDKLSKIGKDETQKLLEELTDAENAKKILAFIGAGGGAGGSVCSFEQTLAAMTSLSGGSSPESERLALLRRFMLDTGIEKSFVLDPSITRGLDYYTGVVFETFLTELPDIGSVCSGGRYDNLAGLYTKSRGENVSGVGTSIGLDRLIAALESLEKLPAVQNYASTAIACLNEENGGLYQALAEKFREAGVPCEVFLEPSKSSDSKQLVKQYVLAEKKGIRWLVIPPEDLKPEDLEKCQLTLRDLGARQNREGTIYEAIKIIKGE